ncbi:MAG: type II toxin-antitoxin system Phd/YefM family antitoxin [Steroidobacter sp.]
MSMYIWRMAQRYAIAEARANLPTLIDEVEAGASIELTRRGEVVAVMMSINEYQRLHSRRVGFQEAYQQFLKKHSLADVGVDAAAFAKQARDRSTGRKVPL